MAFIAMSLKSHQNVIALNSKICMIFVHCSLTVLYFWIVWWFLVDQVRCINYQTNMVIFNIQYIFCFSFSNQANFKIKETWFVDILSNIFILIYSTVAFSLYEKKTIELISFNRKVQLHYIKSNRFGLW